MSDHVCTHGHQLPEKAHVPDSAKMTPMDILWAEHRVIEQVLAVLSVLRKQASAQRILPLEDANAVIDILRTFADTCHHGKEEDILFPAMEAAAGGAFQPVAVMRDEHVMGRNHIAAMASAIGADDVATFCSEAEAYVTLLSEHIRKEDHCLFGFARQLLDDRACADLIAAFHRVEHEDLGSGVHERMLSTANRLADRYGVARASDDPRVLSLVTAHCGCPTVDEAAVHEVEQNLAQLRAWADRVALVHRGHDPRVGPLATVVADAQTHVHDWHSGHDEGSALDHLTAQDRLRGDLRRMAALSDDFTCFPHACTTAVKLYAGLQAVHGDLTQVLDAAEAQTLQRMRAAEATAMT